MSIRQYTKDPDATLDYTINWSLWLNGDTINSSIWMVPSGITSESSAADATSTTIVLSGGTVGQYYDIVNHIVTDGGLEDDRTFTIFIEEQ